MRNFLSLLLAALLGGLVAGAALLWGFQPGDPPPRVTRVVHGYGGDRTLSYPSPPETAPLSNPNPVDLRAAARLATPAVVHIRARSREGSREAIKALFERSDPRGRPPGGEGSGVIYSADGYIVTNYHVIEGADQLEVSTSDRRSYPATVVGSDAKTDLAVLKIEARKLPYLRHADSDAAETGQWVLAVGSPLGLMSTVTAGIVSAKGRNLSILPDLDAIESFIQTDAAVNPGNSGGPLVDANGRLLGINTAIASQTGRFQGYSFAIPINLAERIVDDIIAYGSYRRPLLGVEISSLTDYDIDRLAITGYTQGVLVDAVFPGGAAARADLRVNDLIVSVGDRHIRTLPEFTEIVGRARGGQTLLLRVIRDNEPVELPVTMVVPSSN